VLRGNKITAGVAGGKDKIGSPTRTRYHPPLGGPGTSWTGIATSLRSYPKGMISQLQSRVDIFCTRVDITCPKDTQVHPYASPQLDHLQKEKIVFGKGEFRGVELSTSINKHQVLTGRLSVDHELAFGIIPIL
jgi:hypothetical protein